MTEKNADTWKWGVRPTFVTLKRAQYMPPRKYLLEYLGKRASAHHPESTGKVPSYLALWETRPDSSPHLAFSFHSQVPSSSARLKLLPQCSTGNSDRRGTNGTAWAKAGVARDRKHPRAFWKAAQVSPAESWLVACPAVLRARPCQIVATPLVGSPLQFAPQVVSRDRDEQAQPDLTDRAAGGRGPLIRGPSTVQHWRG